MYTGYFPSRTYDSLYAAIVVVVCINTHLVVSTHRYAGSKKNARRRYLPRLA